MNKINYDVLNTTPTIRALVYENLPPFLKEITEQFSDQREKDIVLTSCLVILGGCFTNIQGKYSRDWVSPNLYALIVAGPAQGKENMKYSKLLGKKIQDNFFAGNKVSKEKHLSEFFQWKELAKQDKATAGSPPNRPKYPVLFIPGNSSASSIYNLLDSSNGIGIICETETDTLTGAIKQDWGNFSHLLRCAFQNETLSLSRKTNDEYISIERPRLSTLLSGTPDQVPRLISSADDGLFSRFLFYCFNRELGWIDQTPCKECSDLEDYFTALGVKVANLKTELDATTYIFNLSDNQFSILNANFSKKLEGIKLFEGDGAASPVYRLGLISFRIAMILTVLRNMDNLSSTTNLECSDQDFETAMSLSDVFFEHSMVMYSLLPKQSRAVTNPKLRQFYALLPQERRFPRSEANEIGIRIGVRARSVGNYLSKLTAGELLTNPEYGIYEKTITE